MRCPLNRFFIFLSFYSFYCSLSVYLVVIPLMWCLFSCRPLLLLLIYNLFIILFTALNLCICSLFLWRDVVSYHPWLILVSIFTLLFLSVFFCDLPLLWLLFLLLVMTRTVFCVFLDLTLDWTSLCLAWRLCVYSVILPSEFPAFACLLKSSCF